MVEGNRIPEALLARLEDGRVRPVSSVELFRGQRSLVLGVPGAFTPVCNGRHIPDFIENAPALRKAGFTQLLCIAPNDPYVVDVWARTLDPTGQIQFLSDGNLDFTRALGLLNKERYLFLGLRSHRYLMSVRGCIITHLRVEPHSLSYSCTHPADALDRTPEKASA